MRREIGLPGAILMGLGSIVGTGVFVSIGVAAGVAGPNVLLAIFLAAILATCNGLSSAQLAASHPVSGGTYEYGHRWLVPWLGFAAGWLFLCAKSASAATALLGLAGYVNSMMGREMSGVLLALAFGFLVLLTILTLVGIKRTNIANSLIVSTTLITLLIFVAFGASAAFERAPENLAGVFGFEDDSPSSLLFATALMFVAYTGYGRIATLGEEVKNPRKTIPTAMIATLGFTMLIYVVVGFVAVAVVGPERLANSTKTSVAPLLFAASSLDIPWVRVTLFAGAITAMLGVVLNLILGLSRVALAMSRRSDLPGFFSTVNQQGIPGRATILVACIIGSLVCIGDVKISWSFSAFTVLLYYSITNLCAIVIEKEQRLYPAWISWCGLIGCLSLAFFVTQKVAIAGIVLLGVGFIVRTIFKSRTGNLES